MDQNTAANAYRQASIENAPPVKLVRLLFEGAIRFLDRAAAEDAGDPRSSFLHFVGRTDAIVSELRLSIDHEIGGEVTENLERLYVFCEDELGNASIERCADRLPAVRNVLETLLEAWRAVEIESTRVA